MNQLQKAERLKALHERDELFVIPNPWDAGSAKLLARMGFEALTTTSAGLAFQLGRPDGLAQVSRDETLFNAAQIAAAVNLPVAADLENGFGHRPEDVAETIRAAADVGLVGGSIEDATGHPQNPIYDFSLALERVQAAVEAKNALAFPFQFVARAENFLHGREDFDDTLRRLVAFEKAGADMLFAPGLPSLDAIRIVCETLARPVTVVMGFSGGTYSLAELAGAGVRRVSTGGSLARAALTGLQSAATEILETGTFGYAHTIVTSSAMNRLMSGDE